MHALGKQAAADEQPLHVAPSRNVVAHPEKEHHHQPQDEGEGDVVVRQFAVIGQRPKGIRAQYGLQHIAAVSHVQAGQAQDDET